jgi:hypothetical protein
LIKRALKESLAGVFRRGASAAYPFQLKGFWQRTGSGYSIRLETHFVLPFDNSGQFVTGVALANPTLNAVVIPASIRNEPGQIIDTRTFSLGPYGHAAFVLPGTWPSTIGR